MRDAQILIIDFITHGNIGSELKKILRSELNFKAQLLRTHSEENISLNAVLDFVTQHNPHLIFLLSNPTHLERLIDLVKEIKSAFLELPVVAFIENGEADQIISLMKCGATDFITPPVTTDHVLPRIWKLVRQDDSGEKLVQTLKREIGLKQLLGKSPAFQAEIEKIPIVAMHNATILISGETGTGKELYARAIHYLSPRASRPFIPVNCGAIPLELVENELFGHERGAYTGAFTSHRGLIDEANGGTLFLDEIDCLPPPAQIKLLRLLQEREYRKIGSPSIKKADVRIISATNSDLEQAVSDGKFRHDLFYRLNIIPIKMPALRDRKEDIPDLARHFLDKSSSELKKEVADFAPEALQELLVHDWPGNVRELENIVERAVVFAKGSLIQHDDIALHHAGTTPCEESFRSAKSKAIEDFEKNYIQGLLLAHRGNITRAARAARKNRRAFWELIRKHKIEVNNYTSNYIQ